MDFPLPQFILIGKQSVGKSRLVEALAGEQFNFVSGTLGSRRPTVLEFRNVTQHESSSKWCACARKLQVERDEFRETVAFLLQKRSPAILSQADSTLSEGAETT